MNKNIIIDYDMSNPDSETLYREKWPYEPKLAALYYYGWQCGGCDYYAKLNTDFGLCLNIHSRHFKETVFEHFTCYATAQVGWNIPHGLGKSKVNMVTKHQLEWMETEYYNRRRRKGNK